MHHDLVDVLIIEDESELARLHAELVQKHPRLRLAGMAASLAQARQLLHATPPQLVLSELKDDLRSIEGSYTQYLGLSSVIRLGSADFSQRLIKALALRLRTVFEAASNDVDMWSKSLTAPVDAQLRERKRSYTRRLEAVDRIKGAATGLEERITEMENAQLRLAALQAQLVDATAPLSKVLFISRK